VVDLTLVFDRQSFPVLRQTAVWADDHHFVGQIDVRYRSANMANLAIHPFGVGK